MSTKIRLTVSLFILSLLTLNIAWAVEECAFTDPGQASGLPLLADGQPSAEPENADLDCDNWCLGWVSPVAPVGGGVSDIHITAIITDDALLSSYSSLPIPPSLQPPIA
jgi:hypothetical protein